MAIRVTCPNPKCAKVFGLKTELAGKTVKCDACRTPFTVPPERAEVGGQRSATADAVKAPAGPGVQSAIRSPQSAMQDPLVGHKLGHYLVESKLGAGGMATVYKGRDLRLDKTVALKVMSSAIMERGKEFAERFIREARSAARIEHANVLPVQFIGAEGETLFIAMQYVDGGTLEDLLKRQGRLHPIEATRIVREVALALAAAHAHKIIHRDIKPSNVMLTKDGRVLVADFGLAKSGEATTTLTSSGVIMGTPAYMSPEQGSALPVDARSDLYSLGVMYYQLVTGALPYVADNPLVLISQHVNADLPDPKALVPDLDENIRCAIVWLMAKNPQDRFQSASDLVQNLNAILGMPQYAGLPSMVATPVAQTPAQASAVPTGGVAHPQVRGTVARGAKAAQKKSPVPILVGALCLLAVAGLVAYIVIQRRGAQEGSATETAKRLEVGGQRSETTQPPAAPLANVAAPFTGAQQGVAPRSATTTTAARQAAPASPPSPLPKGEGLGVRVAPAAPASPPSPLPKGEGLGVRVAPAAPASPLSPLSTGGEGKGVRPPAVVAEQSPALDLLAYFDDIKSVNGAIDDFDYSTARARANLLKDKYASLIAAKLANLDRIESLRKRCFERVNSGAAKVSMEDVSKRYAFAGEILGVDGKGLKAKISKPWSAFTKEEIGNFYRKAADPKEAEDFIALAAFMMEGHVGDKELQQATDALGQAAGLKADVSAHMKYIETLRQAAKEYAEAVEKGKALETAEGSRQEAEGSKKDGVIASGEAAKQSHAVDQKPETRNQKLSYDDVYVTTAATGEKIPHPLSRKTYKIIYQGKHIDVPEGMVFVPAGPFIMGDDNDPVASPAHKVDVPAFFMGKYEVTNAEYMEFVKATGHPMPEYIKKNAGEIPKGRENHPVTYVRWEDAKAYCDWCGKRLPSEAEWEKAATWDQRTKHKNRFPWGDTAIPDTKHPLANWAGDWGYKPGTDFAAWKRAFLDGETGKRLLDMGGPTSPAGTFEGGRSPYHCYDMSGNCLEWVLDWFDKYPGNTKMEAKYAAKCGEVSRVLRSGSWTHWSGIPASTGRYYGTGESRKECGFRCAADYPWKPSEGTRGEGRGTGEATEKGKSAESAKSADKSKPETRNQKPETYDDVYVTTAATGDKIPHPLSKKTETIIVGGRRIKVPEGMVYVPAGIFTMGEAETEHKVYLDAYFIGKYEVTNAEWKAFTDATGFTPLPSHWKGGQIPEGKDNHPVVCVSWEEIQKYCEWVSEKTGRKVTLPTEAQWEKAAGWDPRKRAKREYPWGNQWDKRFCNNGWLLAKFGFRPNDEGDDWTKKWKQWSESEKGKEIIASGGNTAPAGAFAQDKSAYGCYDMGGNVYEWCADWFKTDYYKLKDAKKNPQGPDEDHAQEEDFSGKKSKARVQRGGSWDYHSSGYCRTVSRGRTSPSSRGFYGFRVVVVGTP